MKIAVVGCGIAGPATAIFLKRAGHDVSVFERAPKLGPVGAGILLQPGGMAVLDRLDCGDEVREQGAKILALEGFQISGDQVLDLPYAALKDGRTGIGIHRGRLFTILLEKMLRSGMVPQTDAGIRRVTSETEGTFLDLENGAKLGPYDLVVVADGARAQALCGSWRPPTPVCHDWGAWWMSLPDPDGLFPDVLHQIFDGSRRLMGVLPTGVSHDGNRSVSIFWGIKLDEALPWQAKGIDFCRAEMARLEPRLVPVLKHLRDPAQMTLARYFSHCSRQWFSERIVAVGDAAHAMSPHLGQGANLALLDSAALSDSLQESSATADALMAYQKKREQHVRMYHLFSRMMTPFFQSDVEAIGVLRDGLMPVACQIPFIQNRMLRVLRGEVRCWGDLMRG